MSKNTKAKKKKGISLNLILILQLIIMLGLSLFITKVVSDRTRQNSLAQLDMITDERAQVIANYIEVSERQLKDFSKASQVVELLENPDDSGKLDAAQRLTKTFAMDIPYLEGIYISKWDTTVMTHSSMTGAIGKATREGDSLKLLQDTLIERGKEVYNTGIIISPASGKQIVSMYKAVFGSNNMPVGLVGMGIYTDGLINTLDHVAASNDKSNIKSAFYRMVKADTSTYIFHTNKDLVGQEIEFPKLKDLCQKYNGNNTDAFGNYEYEDNGVTMVTSYVYMSKYNWIFTINDPKTEIYALTNYMRLFLLAFGAILVALTVVFFFINKRQEKINERLVSTIARNAQTRQSLNTAMFKDVLTNANNRVSFSMDMENSEVSAEKPCYFLMFNILGFSDINTRFGNDAGDRLLVRTVDTLKENFPEKTVYRTGSDEFVVMIPTDMGQPTPDQVLNDVNTAFRQLMVPEKVENLGAIYPKYKIAVIKRSGAADSSVVSALKDMTNRKGEATYGMIDYREM